MRSFVIIFGVILMLSASITANASDLDDIIERQEEQLGIENLQQSAEDAGSEIVYGSTLDEGLSQLLELGKTQTGNFFRCAIYSSVLMMIVVLLCGVGDTLYNTLGGGKLPLTALAGTMAITAIAISDVNSMLGLGRVAISKVADFANILLPTVAAVTAMTGAVSGAAVRQIAAIVFSDLTVNLIDKMLIPMLYGFIAAMTAFSATGNEGLRKLGVLLKWGITTVLTAVMIAFIGYLSVSGVIAGSADAMAIKATKFAISGAIPVVGGILSDAADAILASAGILKGSVGVFGMLTILSLCLLPVLKLAIHYLMYKLVAAVSATVGNGRVCTLIDQIGSAFGMLLGMTGASCLLMLISLVSSVMMVSR